MAHDLATLIRDALVTKGNFSIAVTSGAEEGEFVAYYGVGRKTTSHQIARADDPVAALIKVLTGDSLPNPPAENLVRSRIKPAVNEIEDLLS